MQVIEDVLPVGQGTLVNTCLIAGLCGVEDLTGDVVALVGPGIQAAI